MKRFFTLACLLVTAMSSFALTIEAGKVYTISNRNDNNLYVQDNGGDGPIAMGAKNDNSLWILEDAGNGNFYVKNFTTGRYAQECSTSTEVSVTLGDTPVAYSIVDCSAQEGENCFGLTSTNQSVTNFTAGCIGWNWKNDNTVQTFAAVAGSNHRSFWKITEAPTSVTLDKTEYHVGDPIVVTYINTPGGAKDWMAIYKSAQSPGDGTNSSTYRYVSAKSGKMTLNVEDAPNWEGSPIAVGEYYVAYLLNDGYTEGLPRTSFKVVADAGTLTLDKEEYEIGDPVVVTYANTPGGAKDWIGIYKKNETPGVGGSHASTYRYVTGTSGEMTLNVEDAESWSGAITPGEYYVTYLLNDGYDEALDRAYFTVNNPAGHEHSYVNGFCTCTGDEKFEAPAQDGEGYYLVDNAGKVEWISAKVAAGDLTVKVKLTADIDFENKENLHSPIGPNTGQKYNGIFDGQGHRIMNMIINRPDNDNIGFFGFLRGNANDTKILNLIIDKSCSITARNRAGGIAGSCQNNGTTITIENCINEASVTVSGQDAAGFVGGVEGNNPKWIIRNCVNAGTITSTHEFPYVGALFCYQGNGESLIENFINIGTINGHRGGNMGRMSGTIRNLVDLSDTNMEGTVDGQNRGLESGLTSEAIASGALAYYMNKVAGKDAFYQTIGTDAYPVPFSTSALVYEHASYRCDGQPLGTATYDNTEATPEIPAHAAHNAQGVCPVCKKNYQEPALVDGWYEIANAGNIEWIGEQVEAGKATNMKFVADIDFEGIIHTPIGRSDAHKFTSRLDGQGHKIMNLVVNTPDKDNVGFFGWVRGGNGTDDVTIENLIIDNTCSFTGRTRVGAFIGCAQVRNKNININNCVNEASVIAKNGRAAAFLGGGAPNNDHPRVYINNCVNVGNVKVENESAGNDDKAAAFIAYHNVGQSPSSTLTNCINLGTITNTREDGNELFVGVYRAYKNCYAMRVPASHEGMTLIEDKEIAATGELTYDANTAAGEQIFKQLIGTDVYPSPLSKAEVYSGWTSLYDETTGYALNGGKAKAYTGIIKGEWLSLTEISGDIPACTPVVMNGTYYNRIAKADVPAINQMNHLKGFAEDVTADGTQYVLAKVDEKVGFYKAEEGTTIDAGKAYLIVDGSNVKAFFFGEDNPTGIVNANANVNDNQEIYNLAGQRIQKMQKGINIVGGKKVLF